MIESVAIDRLMALPASERLALIERLWNSLTDDPASIPVPDWHLDILDQRISEDDSDDSTGETIEELRRRIESSV